MDSPISGSPARSGVMWGDWRLGDLVDALRTIARTLGPTVRVNSLSIYAPTDADPFPVVQLAIKLQQDLLGIEQGLAEDGVPLIEAETEGDLQPRCQAVVGDILVHAWVGD